MDIRLALNANPAITALMATHTHVVTQLTP